MQVPLNVTCLAPFLAAPRIDLGYTLESGQALSQSLPLPLVPAKFCVPPTASVPRDAFFQRWRALDGMPNATSGLTQTCCILLQQAHCTKLDMSACQHSRSISKRRVGLTTSCIREQPITAVKAPCLEAIAAYMACTRAGPPLKASERVARITPVAREPLDALLTSLNLGIQPGLDPDPDNAVAVATFSSLPASGQPQQVRAHRSMHAQLHVLSQAVPSALGPARAVCRGMSLRGRRRTAQHAPGHRQGI